MDLKPLAEKRLHSYNSMKAAVISIPLEIKALECEMKTIQALATEDGAFEDGLKALEDKLIKNIVTIRDLEISYAIARSRVESTDNALSALLQHEKLLLYKLDISREKYAGLNMCEEMECEISAVYKRRKKALEAFTRALFGCVDTDELVRQSEEKLEDAASVPDIAPAPKKKPKKSKKSVKGYDYDADDEEDELLGL